MKITIRNFLAYIYLSLFILCFSFYNTNFQYMNELQHGIAIITIIFFLITMYFTKCTIKELFYYGIVIIFVLISYFKTGFTLGLILVLGAFILRDLKLNEIFGVFLIVRVTFITILISLAALNIINNEAITISKSGTRFITRYGLGYTHPNQLAESIGMVLIVAMILSFQNKKYVFGKATFFGVMDVFLYILTSSRTAVLCISAFLALEILGQFPKSLKKMKKVLKKGYFKFITIILLIALVIPYFFRSSTGLLRTILYELDRLFSSRITFAAAVLGNYKVTLFGGTTDFSLLHNLYGAYAVDNGYINLLYSYGIIFFVIYIIMIIFIMKKLIENQYYMISYAILIISFWGIYENILYLPTINIALLLIGWALRMQLSKSGEKIEN